MVKILLALAAFQLLSFVLGKPVVDNTDELVSVALLYRHGDRSPKTSFPNDPYYDEAYWPNGFKQLINNGTARHYELGRWFRSRYASFLPEAYFRKDILIRSSDVDITLMSAEADLAGLYPPKSSQVWNTALPWQPIPVHTVSKKEDLVICMAKDCKKYLELLEQVDEDPFFVKLNKDHEELYRFVSEQTGWDVTDVNFIKILQGVFYTYSAHNASFIPAWYDTLDKDEINYLTGVGLTKDTFTKEMQRLRIGPFWDYLITQFDNVINNDPDTPKFLMLSGHESTIAAILNSIGAFDYLPMEFAAVVIWELRKTDEGVYYLNTFYKKDDGLHVVTAEGCSEDCALDDFKKVIEPVRVNEDDWADECGEVVFPAGKNVDCK